MNFGILGEAKIAREHVVPAILSAGHKVTHVGRRSPGESITSCNLWGGRLRLIMRALINDPSSRCNIQSTSKSPSRPLLYQGA